MSRERVNTETCHVNGNGILINNKVPIHGSNNRFKEFCGTCSTCPVPITLSSLSPLPLPLVPQYWETETTVTGNWSTEWRWAWRPVFEVAVQEEDMLDTEKWIFQGPRSWCVRVGCCSIHWPVYSSPVFNQEEYLGRKHKPVKHSFCTQVWNEKVHVSCVADTLSDVPGTCEVLRCGVVVDVERGRLGFIDINRGTVLGKIDTQFRKPLYPVFGEYDQEDARVEMKVLSGCDIQMTEDKQKLIFNCLTDK